MEMTHFAVIYFSGDPVEEHEVPELRGKAPMLTLIGAGPEDFCWKILESWLEVNPLREWERAEVLQRDPSAVDTTRLNMKEF